MDQDFILNNGSGGICCKGCGRGMGQLHSFDYLAGVPGADEGEYVEVQFKNTRKGFFINSNNIKVNATRFTWNKNTIIPTSWSNSSSEWFSSF